MRDIDVMHLGIARVICCHQLDDVIVDPGPESTMDTLLQALGDEVPAKILLTHIHLDHAGAAGALARRWPEVEVWVHDRGARHMLDPSRLMASAKRIYGDDMQRLWGDMAPVPEDRLRVLSGGERIGPWRVEYTPGHASHHVSYLHEPSGTAFVGDVAGVRIPPSGYVLAPTPPPDLDVEGWDRSLDLVEGWAPTTLALTHFGRVDDVGPHLAAIRERVHEVVALAARHGVEAFSAGITERIERNAGDVADRYTQAAPPEHLYLGARRYLDKRAAA